MSFDYIILTTVATILLSGSLFLLKAAKDYRTRMDTAKR